LQYTDTDIVDFKERLGRIYDREDTDEAQGCSRFGEVVLDLDTAGALQDPMLRLCHRLITCSIAGRSQAPEKVTVTDLFYLRGMDIGSVNIPYLLARYLRLFASRSKRGAMISGGQFAWVAPGPERQQGAAVGALEAAEDALVVDEGALAVLAPVQAPQPPPPADGLAQTMAQMLARVEEEVHEI
ncbi:hypothetical protein Tco_1266599, partial [Tanacetum coccineum]